jgi:hypothetical protein
VERWRPLNILIWANQAVFLNWFEISNGFTGRTNGFYCRR